MAKTMATSSKGPGARAFLAEHMRHFLATVYDASILSGHTEARIRSVLWEMGQEGVIREAGRAPSAERNSTHQYKEWTLVDRDA